MAHKIFPHGSFNEIAPGLWQLTGSLPFPLKRNMTVVRLKSRGLLIYSAIALNEAGLAELEKLGKPDIIVVPHPFHIMDLAFYKARYPKLKVLGAQKGMEFHGVRVDADVMTALKDPTVSVAIAPGLKAPEVHLKVKMKSGYALVVCDIFAGENSYAPGIGAAIFKRILGVKGQGLGIAKIVKWRQIADLPAVKKWLADLAADKKLQAILVAHGDPLRSNISASLSKALAVL